MFAVTLGETGRGRKCIHVACPENFTFLEIGKTKTGKPRLNKSSSTTGWIARISTSGAYIRGATGNADVSSEFIDSIHVPVRGQGAFGAAGRTGTWDDVIVSTELDEFWLRVKPTRGDAYILLFKKTGEVSKLSYPEAELLDFDLCGSSPTSRGELIRL
jgi:hypothetical protein